MLRDFRTISRVPTWETPFNLTFSTEALILMEIKEPSGRVIYYDKEKNGEARRNDVDHIEERACSNCILQAQDDTIS